RVALTGLDRHPHLADAHDLYARILADKRDYERAFDEWDMTLRIAPNHVGALKGLAFLYFKVGDVGQAVAHLEAARLHAPDDPGVAQALALAQGGGSGPARAAAAGGRHGHVHLTPPAGDALLLVVRDRAVPMGRLAIIAQRAAGAARRWLEQQA